MRNIHHYSEVKFSSFALEKQQKAIIDMLVAIESNIADPALTKALIDHICECLDWMHPTPAEQPMRMDFSVLSQLKNTLSPHKIMAVITPILNIYQKHRVDSDFGVTRYDTATRQKNLSFKSDLPVYAVLDNLRSAYNVGAIFRNAECFGINKLYLCGITPTPDNEKVIKTAMGTGQFVSWQYCQTTQDAIMLLKAQQIEIVALETSTNSIRLEEFTAINPIALILGNEALGIDPEIINQADRIVTIPVFGSKNSLNVSTAFAIAAYSITLQKDYQRDTRLCLELPAK